jgi:hypothetical protein
MNWRGVAARFKLIRNTAAGPAAEKACNAIGESYMKTVKRELSTYPHAPHTKTPSPRGSYPGLISGNLRKSVEKTPAVGGGGVWRCSVAPHTVYARIQEYGGPMHGHPWMRWVTYDVPGGPVFFKRFIELPERPYMRPAADSVGSQARMTESGAEAFAAVIYTSE